MSVQNSETVHDFLIAGLRDAHAMESQAVSFTKLQVDRLEHYPQLKQRIAQHLRETEAQRDRLAECLESLGSGPTAWKDVPMKLGINIQAMIHSMANDEVVKNSLVSYAFENFEASAYIALIETARLAGDAKVETVCRQNLEEEEKMAAWLKESLPTLINKYLARSSAGVQAKR